METFYYVSVNKLEKGQFIKPYGCEPEFRSMFNFCTNLIENHPDLNRTLTVFEQFITVKGIPFSNPYNLGSMMREVLAEQVRKTDFQDKPSRIGSVFIFKKYMDAYRFLFDYRNGKGWIYLCSSTADKIFTGDMSIITNARLTFDDVENGALEFKLSMKKYWEGNEPLSYPETICFNPVTIIEPANLAYVYDINSGAFKFSNHIPIDPLTNRPSVPYDATLIAPVFETGKKPFFIDGNWVNK